MRIWEGHLVSENISDTVSNWSRVIYSNYEDVCISEKAIFTSTDGHKYIYVLPVRSTMARYMGDPKAIYYDVKF